MLAALALPRLLLGQSAPDSTAASLSTADYPSRQAGVFIRTSDWVSIPNQTPSRTHMKHALAPTFTYGIAPAEGVSEYPGVHAQVGVPPGRPVICICHVLSLPGSPVLVRLHAKKTFRELDVGKVHLGSKEGEAERNDLIPTDVSQPESSIWVIQPKEDLPAGEYALMLGTQNVSIFPFTVSAQEAPATGDRH